MLICAWLGLPVPWCRRAVVFGVGEEDDPVGADPLIEVDTTDGGVSLEVGGFKSQAESVDRRIVRQNCQMIGSTLT